jgi:hypothetical protein
MNDENRGINERCRMREIRTRSYTHSEAIRKNVPCPKCDAPLGENCHDYGKVLKQGVHPERSKESAEFRDFLYKLFKSGEK